MAFRSSRRLRGKQHTWVTTYEDGTGIRYHATEVYRRIDSPGEGFGIIEILDSGGWHTPTTRNRINLMLAQGYVTQYHGKWFWIDREHDIIVLFMDKMEIRGGIPYYIQNGERIDARETPIRDFPCIS